MLPVLLASTCQHCAGVANVEMVAEIILLSISFCPETEIGNRILTLKILCIDTPKMDVRLFARTQFYCRAKYIFTIQIQKNISKTRGPNWRKPG